MEKQKGANTNIREFQMWVQRYYPEKMDRSHDTGRERANATRELLGMYADFVPPVEEDPNKSPTEF